MSADGDSAPAVDVSGVRKRFGYRDTLKGIDLRVERGDCIAITGPNGAGKSTLLRILATAWRPSAGRGHVLGHDLQRETVEIRRRIGVVFHESFLRQELTLEENLRFAADLYDVGSDGASASSSNGSEDSSAPDAPRVIDERARFAQLIDRVGLSTRRRDVVRTFSQGMKKRASIARSLLHRPELWILDEPFSGLDPAGRQLLIEMIDEFRGDGGTVLLVTHQVELGIRLATRLVRIADGRLGSSPEGAAR